MWSAKHHGPTVRRRRRGSARRTRIAPTVDSRLSPISTQAAPAGPAAAFAGGASTAATGPLMSEVSDESRRPTAAACRLPLGRQAGRPVSEVTAAC